MFGSGYRDPADVAWKMGKILLKYRPIAPKPASAGNLTSPPLPSGTTKRKGGDKYSRRGRKRRNRSPAAVLDAGAFLEEKHELVTLPLMPVAPERKDPDSPTSTATPSPTSSADTWQSARVVTPQPARPVGSVVTVECVTDTWHNWAQMPFASPAVLERDACPGFVSDAGGRVTWANDAFRNMVVGPSSCERVEAGLVTKGMVPENASCFTCRARVEYMCRNRGKVHMVAPCDVWRLADGKLAWRLDVKAALSLCNL